MPKNFDFSNFNIETIEINPEGWISPLYVEYMITDGLDFGGVLTYCWRVKGTTHTFTIPTIRMDFLSSGDYKKHFENVLEVFRKDFIEWKNEGFITEWSREYEKQFSRFIIV